MPPSHRPTQLNFITGNANKLAEVRAILADTGVELSSKALDLPELQGGIEEISRDKCRRAAEAVGGPVLVEDTCLSFDAFNELPGPYIKWFLAELGPDGLHKLLAAFDNKAAQAICTFAYCEGPGKEAVVFQGRTKGKIVPARGPNDFGWDSAFEPLDQPGHPSQPQTYAEMAKTDKNKISHRGKALEKLKLWLKGGEVEVV